MVKGKLHDPLVNYIVHDYTFVTDNGGSFGVNHSDILSM